MNFELDEGQALLRESVTRQFEALGQAPADAQTWRAFHDLGLLALPFAEVCGGLELGSEALMLVMEAFGRTLGQAPYLQAVVLAGGVLAACEGEAAEDALARLIAGQSCPALCLYEPGSRYRWDTPSTRATRTANGWRLSGRKLAVPDGGEADLLICPAASEDGLTLLLVPADAAGVTRHIRPTPDGRTAADIMFADVELTVAQAIGDVRRNHAVLAAAIDHAIVASCAEAVGAMARLIEITRDYLAGRSQFGVPLGSFQALQHRAADMLVAMEQARSITFHAVATLDAPAAERTCAAAAAKALVNRAARFVGTQAVQLHGGMGLASEYPAGRYFQRLTVIETLFGDTDHMLALVEAGGDWRK
ncbi:acyl-CoA dehydrogenase family protein [Sphingomonas turrisvirgatae]|uniref:Acyl-CoA dehydrogenase n=1 Tax=Sphingomonas turrisvirgatae TaxID=1888892 RepID=A0A1E3LRB4_9SPHN|nr:acyl-CoA dehydrogenase family protein [Sphingomonas turrisvirgatae]ODP36309.1 hypothetical protein BFL28_06340 [Sphingomonas turrisvirgatae]